MTPNLYHTPIRLFRSQSLTPYQHALTHQHAPTKSLVGFESNHGCRQTTMTTTSRAVTSTAYSQGCLGCTISLCSATWLGALADNRCAVAVTLRTKINRIFAGISEAEGVRRNLYVTPISNFQLFTNMRQLKTTWVGFESNHGCRQTTMTTTSRAVMSTAYS